MEVVSMAVLSAKQRKASATVVVQGKPKYPIPDKGHARAALARINQAEPPLTPSQKATVTARAHKVLGTKKGK
jgi:glutathione synthase/RimK-type ligase-like ATP-grasp enzyme